MGDVTFTDRELDVMSILWRDGSGTVAEVREKLSDEPGYTTVLKILQILEAKDCVAHEQEGRAYRYRPLIQQAEAGSTALGRVLNKIFHGSVDLLVTQLVRERNLSRDEVDGLRALVEDLEAEEDTK